MSMFSGMQAYSQQLSYPGQSAMYPGMMPPPPPMMAPQMSAFGSMQRPGSSGMYGEQVAMRMASGGQTAMGIGGASMALAGGLTGLPLDPFSAALSAGRMGFGMAGGGMGGLAMGGAFAAGAALPFYAAGKAAQTYGSAFTGGMQDQGALNSTLRNNFQFQGGQGAFGRGFGQQQMGQIGTMISGELRRNPFSNSGEMNQLISGGADAGQFTAVRDVQQFTQSFRKMLDNLKSIQRELGGTLTDALQFVRSSQQAGVFQGGDRVNFASEIRGAEAVTGMDRNQLVALAAMGSQISRSTGGQGRQGAFGALRGAQTLGAAVQSGLVSQEALSEATGGLTGTDALQSFTTRMLQVSGRQARTAVGRYSIFGMSNAEGTGLDAGMVERMISGDVSASELSRSAHRNVNRMGRARAMNQEGSLRGAAMEQGGMALQIAEMRMRLGDRVMDQGDEVSQLVMRRRFGMNQGEARLMSSLMRNQGAIAEHEQTTRIGARREQDLRTDITENRSFDAFTRQLEHGMSDTFGVTKAREMGRNFMTKISSMTERAMNDVLGVTASSISSTDRSALSRITMGKGTAADLSRVSGLSGGAVDLNLGQQSLAQSTLRFLGLHGTLTPEEQMNRRGVDIAGMSPSQQLLSIQRAQGAMSGTVLGRDREQLRGLTADSAGTTTQLLRAQAMATAAGDPSDYYKFMPGVSANAIDAFQKANNFSNPGVAPTAGSTMGRSSGGYIGEMLGRGGRNMARGFARDWLSFGATRLLSEATGVSARDIVGDYESTSAADASGFIARGGHLGVSLAQRSQTPGAGADEASNIATQRRLQRAQGMSDANIERSVGRRVNQDPNQARLELESIRGVPEDVYNAVRDSELFSSRLRLVLGETTKGGMETQLRAMEREAGALLDPQQKAATTSMISQMRYNLQNTGGIGKEWRVPTEERKRRDQEIRVELLGIGTQYRDLEERLKESGIGGLAARAGEVAGSFEGFNAGRGQEGIRQMVDAISRMDPTSEEYTKTVGALAGGGNEAGRGVVRQGSERRHEIDVLSGRRGGRRRAETALGMVTGNAFGEMEFEVGGRIENGQRVGGQRVRGAANIEQILRRGGSRGREVMQQLTQGMMTAGVSEEDAKRISTDYQSMLGTSKEGGRNVVFTQEEQERLRGISASPEMQKVRESAQKRQEAATLASQRTQDPLGVERNSILTQIRDGISALKSGGGDDRINGGGNTRGEPA